jgi:hypothetical protein
VSEHIEIAKKRLEKPDSVTLKELRENADAARDAARAAATAAWSAAEAAAEAARAATNAANAVDAALWVEKYKEMTGE